MLLLVLATIASNTTVPFTRARRTRLEAMVWAANALCYNAGVHPLLDCIDIGLPYKYTVEALTLHPKCRGIPKNVATSKDRAKYDHDV